MSNQMTYQEALNWASSCINGKNVDQNAPMYVLVMSHDWSTTDWLMHRREIMSNGEVTFFKQAIERILNHEPAQYIVGKAPFYGRNFKVNENVLVPESETEEMIDWVLQMFNSGTKLNVLDIGTGSGVIGITLKLERPNWQVTASDISLDALSVARWNAQHLQAAVHFIESDLFEQIEANHQFDLIISNPPYIGTDEIKMMDEAVIMYEPHIALFAEHQGLAIYDEIAPQLYQYLTRDGVFVAETGYRQENSVESIFKRSYPQADVVTKHDINDLMRMVMVRNVFNGSDSNAN